jgi:hypothetical protein
MTETTTPRAEGKTTKQAASSFAMPDYGIPKLGIPKFPLPNAEMSEAFGEMTEKGVAHARDTYAKAKASSEEVADLFQNAYLTITKGVRDYNLKLFAIARTSTCAGFDHAIELLGTKSPSAFIELSTAQMRKRFDIVAAQNNELCALAQQVATEAAASIKTGISKALNKAT